MSALVTGRGQHKGIWKNQPLSADEWVTDVYRNEKGSIAVCTHTFNTSQRINSLIER